MSISKLEWLFLIARESRAISFWFGGCTQSYTGFLSLMKLGAWSAVFYSIMNWAGSTSHLFLMMLLIFSFIYLKSLMYSNITYIGDCSSLKRNFINLVNFSSSEAASCVTFYRVFLRELVFLFYYWNLLSVPTIIYSIFYNRNISSGSSSLPLSSTNLISIYHRPLSSSSIHKLCFFQYGPKKYCFSLRMSKVTRSSLIISSSRLI